MIAIIIATIVAIAPIQPTQADERGKGAHLGASELMLQMGDRYKNLYWAAKLGQWDFARYQSEEIEELIEKLIQAEPKREKSARAFLEHVYPRLPDAIRSHDWEKFASAFEHMRQQCEACHRKNARAYIKLPTPQSATSPVLNLD